MFEYCVVFCAKPDEPYDTPIKSALCLQLCLRSERTMWPRIKNQCIHGSNSWRLGWR